MRGRVKLALGTKKLSAVCGGSSSVVVGLSVKIEDFSLRNQQVLYSQYIKVRRNNTNKTIGNMKHLYISINFILNSFKNSLSF